MRYKSGTRLGEDIACITTLNSAINLKALPGVSGPGRGWVEGLQNDLAGDEAYAK